MTQNEGIQSEIEGAAAHLLDVAPVERAYLDSIFGELLFATGSYALVKQIEDGCFAYARSVAGQAFALGLELGREAARSERPADDCARNQASDCKTGG